MIDKDTLKVVFISSLVFLAIYFLISFLIKEEDSYNKSYLACASSYGYDVGDVSVFLSHYRISREDFMKSPSVRKQYEHFRSGEYTKFMSAMDARNNQDDSRREGTANGVAVGMVTGMMMGGGYK